MILVILYACLGCLIRSAELYQTNSTIFGEAILCQGGDRELVNEGNLHQIKIRCIYYNWGKEKPASKEPLRTSKQALKPLVFGSKTFLSTGNPFSLANF